MEDTEKSKQEIKLKEKLRKKSFFHLESKDQAVAFCNRYALILHFITCFLGYFLIEWMARHSFSQAVEFFNERTKIFLYNTLLIFITTLPVFFFRRRVFLRSMIAFFWLLFGTANGILLANRVTPLTGPDMGNLGEGLAVVGKYLNPGLRILIVAMLCTVVVLLVFFFFRAPKYQGKLRWKIVLPGILAAGVGFFGLTEYNLVAKQLSSYFGNIAFAYQDYGFPYCFLVTLFDTGIDQPDHYSAALVQGVIDQEGTIKETDTDNLPNIVVVQLESFFDATRVDWLKFSEDPLPNWHSLSGKFTSGLYTVPTVGAGTVNTEFETLTGMSLRFFGAGEYPYKGVLKSEACESAAYDLEKLGYTAHAIHDNYATFYSRNSVYSNLGFNTFTSNEYMDTQEDVNETGWMRDENLIPCIQDALDDDENQDFIFTVSVQGHGAYPTESVIDSPAISVSGASSDEKNAEWEYYVNETHEMDTFVKDLTDYLETRDEPTICLFYGDHLPTLGLSDSDLKRGSTYQTNYLIWDNIGLSQKDKNITAYQAMASVFEKAGIHEGTMFNFQQTMQNSENYLYDMQILQYDILYGKHYVYGQSSPFSPTVLAMGVKPVTLTSLEAVSEEKGIYYVHGENFTQSSVLSVNDKSQDTTYLDQKTLLVTGVKLEKGDWVNVGQQSNSSSGQILSHSNTLVYGVGSLGAD